MKMRVDDDCLTFSCAIDQGFTKSLAMTVLSEIGDKTFFAAAVNLYSLSSFYNGVALEQISRRWSHHLTTVLFFGFGLWSLWEGFTEEGEAEELKEVEAKLNADWKAETGSKKGDSKNAVNAFCHDQVRDDLKKHQRPFLTQFFSPVFLKVIVIVTRLKLIKKINVLFCHANCPATLITQAFSITFFGEWGDKSQVTLNVDLLRLFGCSGQAFCTTAAVLGGKSLASQISEKMVSSCPLFSIIPEMFQNTTLSFGSLMHSLIRLIGCTLQRRTFHNIWSAFLSISNRRRVMNPA
ncbi:hypothetical protein GW17_00006866 [Ensete ventricosum]|nr:hypothetical protein GW17_00006866 [Ensete ventricosum]